MNRSRVLRAVWQRPMQSRVEIASLLGLDKSTVSTIVNELIAHGLVHEVCEGEAASRGGRRPVHLEVVAGCGSVLGMDLQPGRLRAALCDMHGTLLRQWTSELPRNEVTRSVPMELPHYDFQTEISDKFDVPVIVENDANACAWGELAFHRSQNVHDFLYVLVQMRTQTHGRDPCGGLGAGIGVVINGTLHPGTNFAAGEFRSVLYNGQGSDGQGSGQFSLSSAEAKRVASAPVLRARFFRELAVNVALIVNVLNVDHLFLGGDIVAYCEDVQPVFEQELQRTWPCESLMRVDER